MFKPPHSAAALRNFAKVRWHFYSTHSSFCTRAMSHLRSARSCLTHVAPLLVVSSVLRPRGRCGGCRQRNLHCVDQVRAASWPPPSPATWSCPPPTTHPRQPPAAFSFLMQNFPWTGNICYDVGGLRPMTLPLHYRTNRFPRLILNCCFLPQERSWSRTSSRWSCAASRCSSSRCRWGSTSARAACPWWASSPPSSRGWATPPSWWSSSRTSTTSSWSPGHSSTSSTPLLTSLTFPGATAAKEVRALQIASSRQL